MESQFRVSINQMKRVEVSQAENLRCRPWQWTILILTLTSDLPMVNQNFWDVNEFMNLEVRYGEKSIEKMAFTLKDTDIHVLKYHSSRDASHHYSYKYFMKKNPWHETGRTSMVEVTNWIIILVSSDTWYHCTVWSPVGKIYTVGFIKNTPNIWKNTNLGQESVWI